MFEIAKLCQILTYIGKRKETGVRPIVKNKSKIRTKVQKKSCFLGLPQEKRPILSQRFTLHAAWFHSRKITSGFS